MPQEETFKEEEKKAESSGADSEDGEEQQDEQESQDDKMSGQQSQIIETSSVTPVGGKHVIHCLTVVGPVSYTHLWAAAPTTSLCPRWSGSI